MTVTIDDAMFAAGHQAFTEWITAESGGIPFTGMDHPYLIETEIAYKYRAYDAGRRILMLKKWKKWRKIYGNILNAAKGVCAPNVSSNLLEHRYGAKGNSDAPLYRVSTEDEVREFEAELYEFMFK